MLEGTYSNLEVRFSLPLSVLELPPRVSLPLVREGSVLLGAGLYEGLDEGDEPTEPDVRDSLPDFAGLDKEPLEGSFLVGVPS